MIGGRLLNRCVRFWRDELRGIAAVEFAMCAPVLLVAGGYGIELANFAVVNMRVSQATLSLADNASRVGLMGSLSVVQLRESDMNDVLQATRLQGNTIGLTTFGRVTVTSLENIQQSYDSTPVQRIHWQRCVGRRSGANYDSSYGTTAITNGIAATQAAAGTAAPTGMGDAGFKVNAPSGAALMYVEINYDYQPLFGAMFMAPKRIHDVASLIVRDRRDLAQIYNPSPAATRLTCDKYTV